VLRSGDPITVLEQRGLAQVWRRSVAEALAVVDMLDARIAALEAELRPLAQADPRVQLLVTIPGVGEHLGLMIAAEIGDVARFPGPRNLIGFAGLAPRIAQSGQSSRTGALSKAGSRALRWAAIEAAQCAWRPTNPWNRLYLDVKQRTGKSNPAKSAVARKVLIAAWHVLAREEPFKPSRAERGTTPCPGKLPLSSGRLTARDRIEKPGQLPPTRCAAKRRKRTEQSSIPTIKGGLTSSQSSKR
jgi:transposase